MRGFSISQKQHTKIADTPGPSTYNVSFLKSASISMLIGTQPREGIVPSRPSTIVPGPGTYENVKIIGRSGP
jgi:hypothetical protein